MPGAAQRSSTRSPGCGSSSATTACEPRDCADERRPRPIAPAGGLAERAAHDQRLRRRQRRPPLRPLDRRLPRPGARLRSALGLGPDRVHAQRRLRGLVHRRHQRPRLRGAELLPPHPREPFRVGVRQRGIVRRGVVEGAEQLLPLAGGPAQHRVDQARRRLPPRARRSPWPARPPGRRRRGPGSRRRTAARRAPAGAPRARGASSSETGRSASRSIRWSQVPRLWTAP